ncbi:hypothetical protein HO173_003341 [Letharia columbiana]|uniref:Uncharacterized protein n=1 Tax=Letharia columbiana TaxID=112416 RepID=A0A8H6G1K3_9LECA|nr:uncharacterized protein HO173_003341 [Letharia columbiana]KAF6238834.1 hypothetical protein HO173_003341 [Letharia columbiana]
MIYHLVLKEEHGVLLLRFKNHTLSTAYTLGPVAPDDTKDADMEELFEDEERWYGSVNLNGMQRDVYNFRNVGFCMVSRAIYNTAICYFFSMNFFRCLDFDDLENFLQDVRHVHMINKIQVVWKGGYTGGIKAITKGIRALQNRATGLKELHLIVGKKVSEAMLTQEAWRLICEMARQKKWQVHLDGEAGCLLKARQQLEDKGQKTTSPE